jgi:RNA polymerase sigma factor (sigma-70 family)
MKSTEWETTKEKGKKRLRRVVIEERQRLTMEQIRDSLGYAPDVDPNAHDQRTFRLINQRMQLDRLPHAEAIMPALEDWKAWTKMDDWDSRNRLLEAMTDKLRRKEATEGDVMFLVAVCRPAWAAVAANLRTYGGVDVDPGAEGIHAREEARRVNELDRAELDQVVKHALIEALYACPRPFPRRFFPWLKETLAFRALDHVRQDIAEHSAILPHDLGIKEVVDAVLADRSHPAAAFYACPASPAHSQWLRTLDMDRIFEVAEEYATYSRTRTACERAVDRLPTRQGEVIRDRYFHEITQEKIARVRGVAASTVRNTHSKALGNLRRDDELFLVLNAVGKVRDKDRRDLLKAAGEQAA